MRGNTKVAAMHREVPVVFLAAIVAAVACVPAASASPVLAVAANARAVHGERCSDEQRRINPRMAATAISGTCDYLWAKVEPLGCYHFGPSEVNVVYIVTAPGRPPFALTTYTRGPPFAQSTAQQNMGVALDGALPTRASLRAEHRDPRWMDPCPV
ncbi:hypothetical protein ACW5F0_07300 [Luteimonas sp. A534]